MDKSLDQLLSECDQAEGTDFEGDRTYRVHIETAKQLISRAYYLGQMKALEKARSLVDETFTEYGHG